MLQWGRTLLRAEIPARLSSALADRLASMGPHAFACGNCRAAHQRASPHLASMGPHAFACGNEGELERVRDRGHASMGPHAFACGNVSRFPIPTEHLRASMGPHAFACGNSRPYMAWPTKNSLQWGRTLLRAEIGSTIRHAERCRCFNGAARFCVRKCQSLHGRVRGVRASRGPHAFACGNASPCTAACGAYGLQWGRTLLRAEIRDAPGERCAVGGASMGPHAFACGNR